MSEHSVEHPIRVVSLRTGLSPHVIRIWEKRYGAVAPSRTANNRRFYTDSDIDRLQLLRRATLLGRSIGQIAQLPTNQLKTLVGADEAATRGNGSALVSTGDEAVSYLEKSVEAIDRLKSEELASILNRAAIVLSKLAFLEDFIAPLLTRIGNLWETGSLSIIHEHLATSVIRTFLSKLLAGSEASSSAPLLIVSTLSGELHELGAMVVAVTAGSEGWRVAYVGPNLPAAEISKAILQNQPRAIAISIVYAPDQSETRKELLQLRRVIPARIVLIAGGRAAASHASDLREIGAILESNLEKFRLELQRLKTSGPA